LLKDPQQGGVKMKLLAVLSVSLFVLGFSAMMAQGADLSVEMGTPRNAGTDMFRLQLAGRAEFSPFSIDVPINETAEGKALLVVDQLQSLGLKDCAEAAAPCFTVEGAKVTVKGARKWALTRSGSHENIKLGNPPAPQPPKRKGQIDFDGTISGIDSTGAASVFTASLGWDGFIATADLTSTAISSPTVDGLLSDMFNIFQSQLPPSLQPDLVLDLPDQLISFDFPPGQTNYFVADFASDITTFSSLSLEVPVPEPAAVLSFPFGLVGFLASKVPSQLAFRHIRETISSGGTRKRGPDGMRRGTS
jgi:hypothetical protein